MKPALANTLKQISACLEELRDRVETAETQARGLGESREELQKKVWSQSRELHVLREQLNEFPDLRRVNEEHAEMSADFEQRLRQILSYTRALAAAFQQ